MLWLAMESGQTEKGTELLKKLVKQLLTNDELNSNEKRILAIGCPSRLGIASSQWRTNSSIVVLPAPRTPMKQFRPSAKFELGSI
jgi:hypothetical protein